MIHAVKWVGGNWEGLLIVVAGMLSLLSTVKQLCAKSPRATRVLDIVIDVLSIVPKPGMRGVLGRHLNLPGVPSLPPKAVDVEIEDDDDGPPTATIPLRAAAFALPLALFAVISSAGCGTTRAQWTAAGIDVLRCTPAAVMDAAGNAIVSYLEAVGLGPTDFKALGKELVAQYGKDAATCAIGKIWADFGGGTTTVMGQPSPTYAATAWLVNHQQEWAK